MFSANLEMVLNVAYREAESRRHAHLTLEHLLFAIAHEPKGEDVLLACGVEGSLVSKGDDAGSTGSGMT